jgi:hypothetical protein
MNFNINIGEKTKRDSYPSKKHMNLYFKPDKTSKPATVGLYILFILVLILAFAKVFVYDICMDVNALKEEYDNGENQILQYAELLKDYDEIELEYHLYSATPEEEAQIDRIEVIDLIDRIIRPNASVDSISIKGDQLLVQFSGVTLGQTAELVRQLEASPVVAATTVDTASTTENGRDLVKASVLVSLQKEGGE